MSQLLVITFPQRETGGQAAERLKSVEGSGGVHLRDMAVVEKDADGKVHVHHGVDKATAGGAVTGGFLGLLIGAIFFPIAGLAIGAALGGLVGRSLGQNVDSKLVQDVTADLSADSSALFVLGEGNLAAVAGALEPFSGKVYQTTLDPDAEAQVQAALDRETRPEA
jgi:uncharacterized membrane protein